MPATRGTPIQGSRAAHSVATPALHASDLEAGAPTVHNPLPTVAGSVPMADGTKYVLTDVLTPTEHTAIGDGTPHHAAVTLGIGNDAALALSGQELTLMLPALADHDHSGDAGDGGTFDAANLTSGAATDGQVLTADGFGGAAWEDATGGGSLTVEEADGTPSVSDVTTIKVTNGTLTDNTGGVVTLDFGSAATDAAAIHDNVANEISAIAEKTTPANDDLLLIEDSAASYAKKSVKMSNLPSGGSGGATDVLLVQVFS
jgi:hypothetical protein